MASSDPLNKGRFEDANTTLEIKSKYLLDHVDEIAKQYDGSYVVTVGETVIGTAPTIDEAYLASIKDHKAGTFFIHKADVDPATETRKFQSRVRFLSLLNAGERYDGSTHIARLSKDWSPVPSAVEH